jgi:hypothetical protein
MTKKNLTITISLLGITREAFIAYVTTLTQCTQVLVSADPEAVDGACMCIEEVTPPSSAAPPSESPVSRSVLN